MGGSAGDLSSSDDTAESDRGGGRAFAFVLSSTGEGEIERSSGSRAFQSEICLQFTHRKELAHVSLT